MILENIYHAQITNQKLKNRACIRDIFGNKGMNSYFLNLNGNSFIEEKKSQ